MTCQESIENARASFLHAVSEGVSTLMEQCGYSRDRATSALMRELSRGDSTRPGDKEVFDTMKLYSLGIEEATKTFIISKALRRAMETTSPAKAIEMLASKIAVRKLLYESSEDDGASEDETLTIRPELRVEPISTVERHQSARTKSTPIRKAKYSGKAARARKTPCKPAAISRKRPIEEMASAEKEDAQTLFPNRPRSDSVSEEVSAKIASHPRNEEAPIPETNTARSAPSVRTKRGHRSDDSEASTQPGNKRLRGSEV